MRRMGGRGAGGEREGRVERECHSEQNGHVYVYTIIYMFMCMYCNTRVCECVYAWLVRICLC